ncbi:CoA-binding protein, partial [candidate division WOR-3 bacterium]|nr:CoA-binding protein [candidate division WOR-3 bacterium]
MMKNKTPNMKYLFEPQSVAVIGASHNKDKIGYKIVENIIDSKYAGKVYPVNPKGGEILGLKVYRSLNEIDKEIDLVCITIPAKYTFDAVKDCASNNVRFITLITSGFSEIGNIKEERRIVEYANKNRMRVLGPNIFGVYSSRAPINLTFGPKDIKPGSIAIITQSGAIGIAMLGKTKAENVGVSAVVSVGNKSDIDEADLLEYLLTDGNTKVILMYIEGIKNGEKLFNILKKSTKKKPIIVIKSGKSKRGALAAASHTGSLAGADEIFSDIMRQCGVIRAESIQDAFNWCKFLANSPFPKGENTIIITNGGGIGVMATDACEKYGVHLYDDIQTTEKIFKDVVPEFGSVKNPIDL